MDLHRSEETKYTQVTSQSENGTILASYQFQKQTLTLFRTLDDLIIPFETEIYRPKPERLDVGKNIFYCKNLFLKDRKGQFYLVICHEDYEMDLKQLRKTLNAYRNFNFATANEMAAILDTEPGGVTPLALMNKTASQVKMVIHKSLTKDNCFLMFHPFDSQLATKITLPSLLRFLKHFKHSVTFVE